MDIMKLTRELGRALQQDQTYINMSVAEQQYNKELREIYGRVMQNEHMAAYQAAKNEFDALMQRVTGVLSMCAEGQDPDGCDPDACGCTGSCATCGGGCH